MVLDLVIAIFVTSYLRKSLQTSAKLPKWDRIFYAIYTAAIVLLILDVAFSPAQVVTTWGGHLLMLYLIYILYREPELAGARQVLLAVAPYILLSLFSDIVRKAEADRYSAWKSFLQVASIFAIIWMVAMWIIITRQRKALDREKAKAHQEEEKKIQIISLKDQLEIQVAQRTAELTKQKEELQQTLFELKATQAQLIQSEKMASLGELTAGIAHEIQNPLNFVNNFAEVNTELVNEMQQEIERGNFQEVKSIAHDIGENEEKISFHGKRADAIVKGMLQHSRKNTGQKEPTDINALTDEYLRLSYHGLRAKDKSFNATVQTELDPAAQMINIVPQDIGRVLLNLINNAFYAVAEKKKVSDESYTPLVTVCTRKLGDKLQISIKDNGNGIPQKVLDKIFQPFFTTKPTGQGTGLGLSLSYDIVKAHGGDINVQTQENDFTEFTITLPYD